MTKELQYYERMASGLDDKLRMFDFLPPVTPEYAPHILDVGAGGGELTGALLARGYRVTALDVDRDAYRGLVWNYPDAKAAFLYASEVEALEEEFDAIVACSVMHEIYSYGDDEIGMGDMRSIEHALQAFANVLKPGGILVIRDGVKPENAAQWGTVKILSGEDTPVTEYLDYAVFPEQTSLACHKEGVWFGTMHSIMEFVFTYNWGVKNYNREAGELYGIMKLDEYAEKVESYGFTTLHKESYILDGYVKGLSRLVRITSNDKPVMFDTNALWAFRKGES